MAVCRAARLVADEVDEFKGGQGLFGGPVPGQLDGAAALHGLLRRRRSARFWARSSASLSR